MYNFRRQIISWKRSSIRPVLGYHHHRDHRSKAKSVNLEGRQHVQIDGMPVNKAHNTHQSNQKWATNSQLQIFDIHSEFRLSKRNMQVHSLVYCVTHVRCRSELICSSTTMWATPYAIWRFYLSLSVLFIYVLTVSPALCTFCFTFLLFVCVHVTSDSSVLRIVQSFSKR